ncbi:MAG TPA: thiazole biosynthesis protein [Candidatus Altiarchaeales archaeon]|nr:thiazole biosynthesis protein [Candidatus Altiarchaeales archaeon]
MIDEIRITKAIIRDSVDEFLESLDVEVAIAGGGPSGLVAAKYLADNDIDVILFERKLSVGGGMWGGGMMYPRIVVQTEAKEILDDFGIKTTEKDDLYVANSIESVVKITANTIDSGARIFNGISVEDVMIRENEITGFVVNWSSILMAGLHVDPVTIGSKFCIDATGHATEICRIVQGKVGKLNTPSGEIEGERSMWAEKSENLVVENTREVYNNLYVAGMAANAVFGAPRMGPIFGGMLLSGRRVAELIINRL